MTSSKFSKSFRGAGDLMVLGEVLKDGKTRQITENIIKHHQVTSTSSETCSKSPHDVLISLRKIEGSFFVSHGPSPKFKNKQILDIFWTRKAGKKSIADLWKLWPELLGNKSYLRFSTDNIPNNVTIGPNILVMVFSGRYNWAHFKLLYVFQFYTKLFRWSIVRGYRLYSNKL